MMRFFDIPEEIAVGIPTVGVPRLVSLGDGLTRLENMLIGKDFHWQQELSVVLPGRVEVVDGQLINYVPLETYLECVVGSEMNPAAPGEFLKAHAIISRSWAVGKILGIHPEDNTGRVDTPECLIGWDDTSDHMGFHVCSDDHCQRYQGVQPVAPEVLEAIRSTAGLVLTDKEGKLIVARF
ncbi:MAG: SpoIID/LytB domain-containing protein, partial [Muribaculaceae bacterium]|nr:SpoIID/LytB domain-containing protein [Muribaculaceae bacterium]